MAVNRLCAQRNGALQHLLFATHYNYVMFHIDQGGTTCRNNAAQKDLAMILDNLMSRARASIAKRRQYNRLIAEIDSFSSRDLADMRADRSEMLYQVHKQIYG